MIRTHQSYVAVVLSTVCLVQGSCTGTRNQVETEAASVTSAAPAALSGQPTGTETPLRALHSVFRSAYDRARDAEIAGMSPLVVARFSDLYLIRDGQVIAQGKGIPGKYHLLHRTAHVPLVMFCAGLGAGGGALTPERRSELERYAVLLASAREDLGNYGFSNAEIAAQELLIDESRRFIGDALQTGAILPRALIAYRTRVAAAMMLLADLAGAAQVDATHELLSSWRGLVSDEEWARLRVVIVGPRQPRHNYAATQYFAAVFGGDRNSVFPGETDRVFYVESLTFDPKDRAFLSEKKAVATIVLDRQASSALFNDPYRMSIDVMADGAARRIGELDLSSLASPVVRP